MLHHVSYLSKPEVVIVQCVRHVLVFCNVSYFVKIVGKYSFPDQLFNKI